MKERGQSLVELALSILFLLLLLSGAVEFGMAFFQFVQLRDAAQEAALYGSVCQDFAKIEERARGASNSPIDLRSDAEVLTEIVEGGNAIKVTLSYDHKVFMPFVTRWTGEYISLDAFVIDTILDVNPVCG